MYSSNIFGFSTFPMHPFSVAQLADAILVRTFNTHQETRRNKIFVQKLKKGKKKMFPNSKLFLLDLKIDFPKSPLIFKIFNKVILTTLRL